MLVSAKAEDMTSVLEAAKTIDGFPRPTRGNRPTARKLNEEGLNALDASKPDEAIRLFSQATQADPSDQEIISNLAYAYAQSGQLAKSEDTAVLALSLNPRRTSVWAPLATTLAKEHRYDQALEAMWLAYQFSGDKAKTLIFIDSKLASESNPDAIKLYTASKTWFEKNEKPALLQWPK
ncbi:Tetratricopeptide repeat-containing protein [Burkholderia sp. WP9]|nr:Tetratricopeptide repeat-containing protein [Burkholderia sp. WP9]